jgi:hypothetical protein
MIKTNSREWLHTFFAPTTMKHWFFCDGLNNIAKHIKSFATISLNLLYLNNGQGTRQFYKNI